MLCLLATLIFVQGDARRVARQAEETKVLIDQTTRVVDVLYDVGYAFLIYNAHTSRHFERKLEKLLIAVPTEIRKLEYLVRDRPLYAQTVKDIEEVAKDALLHIDINRHNIEGGGPLDLGDALVMQDELDDMVKSLGGIIASEQATQLKFPEEAARLQTLTRFLMIVLIGTIAITLAVVLWFAHGTQKRLASLMRNIDNFGKQEPLSPTLTGKDEIAQIDKAFHEMAEALTLASRQKQEFVDMISHDLRTPLSAVQVALSLASSGQWGQLSEQGQQRVINAEENIRRSIGLINNLLEIEKIQSGNLELHLRKHELLPILEIAVASLSQLAERKNIKVALPDTEASVNVDEGRMSQVLANLLGNAIKFAPPGSEIKFGVEENTDFTKIKITDQGPGIAPDDQTLVFERFKQSGDQKSKTKGTGLGLAICRMIVEAHGGSIGVESEEGKGSTFWFSVPSA